MSATATETSAPQEGLAFPASVAQQAFWYLELLDKNVSAFNVPLRFQIDGKLDPQTLERAITTIASRHEILRTHFEEENGELLQVVSPAADFTLAVHDLSSVPADPDSEADRIATEEAHRCFTLSKGPLFRAGLVKLSAEKHHLLLTFHHAIFDGLSIGVFIDELARLHEAFAAGNGDPLPPLPIQYGDYSVWQKDFLSAPEIGEQLSWWRENLRGMTEPDFPTDHPRPSRKSWKGKIVSRPLPDDLIAKLTAVANAGGASLFHVQLAAFKLLVQRYAGTDEVSIGTPVSGRTNDELEPLIGVFINSLIIRSDLSGNPTFSGLLSRVRDNALQAIERQDLPFENLVRELKPERDPGRNPLFQINFSQDRFAPRPTPSGPVTITPVSSRSPGCIFDLHLFVSERGGSWKAGCDYSSDLFDPGTAERILGHYHHLLTQIAENPDKPLADYELPLPAESELILGQWKGGTPDYPRTASIGSLFIETALRSPDRTALVHGSETVSYGSLLSDASALAADLAASGVRAGDLVALSGKPSPALVTGMLAIVLAGGAYVPMNPADPSERAKLLLDECGAKFLLHDQSDIPGFDGTSIAIPPAGRHTAPYFPQVAAESPAYLMFTSGSTGTPKGVIIPHRAVVRLVRNNRFLNITPEDVFLLAAPVSFDASTLEIWGPLLNGGKLVIPEGGTSLDRIASAVGEEGVTTLWLTSGLFNLMIEEHAGSLAGLRHLLAGGDVLSVPHVKKALAALPATKLINGYGPTENTTFTTCHHITREDLSRPSIPIGRPISNSSAFILDPQGKPVPAGIRGELFTGGDGLAIGYHNDPVLTAEKFIDHPEFGRLYRTGDLCRWTADGTIEFIGRTDHQVKVRGFRIEPGEIEAALVSHPEVRGAKVAVRGTGSDKRILAWVRPANGSGLTPDALGEFLSRLLPPFMCPDAIAVIDRFPINANGKIDVRALADPIASAIGKPKTPPRGETEEKLAAIWSGLLGVRDIGREDGFFELGGHSLMALRMFSRINREFDRSLPLSALISHPTIAELARLILPDQAPQEIPVAPAGKGRLVTLSPSGSQPPLFCIHGGDGGILFYRDMAAGLPTDIPVHAIESTELDSSAPIPQTSVGETAASYVRTLLAAYPKGPFRLAGYSFGGIVAYEMACILAAKGYEIDFLGLLDTHNPSAPHHVNSFPERVGMFWNNHNEVPLLPRSIKLLGRFADGVATHQRVKKEIAAARKDGPAEAHGDLRRVQIRQENWRAMQAYKPNPFPGKITLFKAKDQSDKVRWPDDYGWKELGQGGFEIIPVEGKHLTLFEPEHVGHLIDAMRPVFVGKNR